MTAVSIFSASPLPHPCAVQARRLRKVLGGGMRQAGVIAAPGIVALTEQVSKLAQDHSNAKYDWLCFSSVLAIGRPCVQCPSPCACVADALLTLPLDVLLPTPLVPRCAHAAACLLPLIDPRP